jgi:hypothetical protein
MKWLGDPGARGGAFSISNYSFTSAYALALEWVISWEETNEI